MGEVAVTPSMAATTRRPCKALLADDDQKKEDRAGSSGFNFKPHRSFSAEATEYLKTHKE